MSWKLPWEEEWPSNGCWGFYHRRGSRLEGLSCSVPSLFSPPSVSTLVTGVNVSREGAQSWWARLPPENASRILVLWSLRPGLGRIAPLGNSKGTLGTQKSCVLIAPTKCLVSMPTTCVCTCWFWETMGTKRHSQSSLCTKALKIWRWEFWRHLAMWLSAENFHQIYCRKTRWNSFFCSTCAGKLSLESPFGLNTINPLPETDGL